jgi:hypothetical protein
MNQSLVTQNAMSKPVLRRWLCYLSICGHGSEVGAIKTIRMCVVHGRNVLNRHEFAFSSTPGINGVRNVNRGHKLCVKPLIHKTIA